LIFFCCRRNGGEGLGRGKFKAERALGVDVSTPGHSGAFRQNGGDYGGTPRSQVTCIRPTASQKHGEGHGGNSTGGKSKPKRGGLNKRSSDKGQNTLSPSCDRGSPDPIFKVKVGGGG